MGDQERFIKKESFFEEPESAKVLVIDDEDIMRNLLKDLLSDINFSVTAVENGEQGVLAYQKEAFDVVITDLRMPGIDGIRVLEEIKRSDENAVVIVITGYGALKSAQDALRLGAFDYITKPFELDDITFVVKRAIQTRKLLISNDSLMTYLEQQNVLLDKKVTARTKELEVLYQVGKNINTLQESDLFDAVVQTLVDDLKLKVCSLFVYEQSTKMLTCQAVSGNDAEKIKDLEIGIGEGVSGYVFQTGQAILAHDTQQDLAKTTEESQLYFSSLISVPIKIKDSIVGVLNISGKENNDKFSVEDFDLLKEVASLIAIGLDNARLYKDLQEVYIRTVTSLVSAIDAKDSYTRSHSENVASVAEKIAIHMKLDQETVGRVKLAGQLHDIGKIGIKDSILTKPERLNQEEWEEMKTHSEKAVEILGPLQFLHDVVQIVKHNHERWDGDGYPDALKGEEIELGARIIAVADAFDTMTSKRPYRKKILSKEELIEEYKRCSGKQFDPVVVDAFLEILEADMV